MLKINNLTIKVSNNELLHDINLEIKPGEIHALMGPNGAGKSTICKAILNHYSLEKSGTILFLNKNITNANTDEIAKMGIFYLSQNPMEIEGISNAELLRSALNEKNEPLDIFKFNKLCNTYCEQLKLPKSFIHREVNVSMSGGEKKKNELLGMLFLKPKLIILDEVDSGLDIDAIKIVSKTIKEYQKTSNCALLIVTHQPTLLNLLKPDYVHLIMNNTILKTGKNSLLKEILEQGYEHFGANIITKKENEE